MQGSLCRHVQPQAWCFASNAPTTMVHGPHTRWGLHAIAPVQHGCYSSCTTPVRLLYCPDPYCSLAVSYGRGAIPCSTGLRPTNAWKCDATEPAVRPCGMTTRPLLDNTHTVIRPARLTNCAAGSISASRCGRHSRGCEYTTVNSSFCATWRNS